MFRRYQIAFRAILLGQRRFTRKDHVCPNAVIQCHSLIDGPPQPQFYTLTFAQDRRRVFKAVILNQLRTMKAHPVLKEDSLLIGRSLINAKKAGGWPDKAASYSVSCHAGVEVR